MSHHQEDHPRHLHSQLLLEHPVEPEERHQGLKIVDLNKHFVKVLSPSKLIAEKQITALANIYQVI